MESVIMTTFGIVIGATLGITAVVAAFVFGWYLAYGVHALCLWLARRGR